MTSNLAEFVGFTRAVNWAHANRLAQGKSVCIRYDSMYAAHIATGLWKAKKHKPMAAAARQAWARLKRSREGQAWMAHVKGHTGNQWNERADRLAAQGRGGNWLSPDFFESFFESCGARPKAKISKKVAARARASRPRPHLYQ